MAQLVFQVLLDRQAQVGLQAHQARVVHRVLVDPVGQQEQQGLQARLDPLEVQGRQVLVDQAGLLVVAD